MKISTRFGASSPVATTPTVARRASRWGRIAALLVVAGLSAGAAQAGTMTLGWTANPETSVTGYDVSWGLASGTYTHLVNVGAQTTYAFTAPDPTVPYFFVVQAYNATGLSAFSLELQALPTVTGAAVALTGAGTGLTATSATLNGTANPRAATATGTFQYGLTASYGKTTPLVNVGTGSAPVAISAALTALTCATPYHFRAVATNSVGSSSGADATFTTAACPGAGTTDSTGAVWTLAANQAVLRNGVSAAGGYGSKILLVNGTIYVLGDDNNWWQWTTNTWTFVGPTAPTKTPTASPSGTVVPTVASLTDAALAVWTISPSFQILRNGAQAAGAYGTQIRWVNGTIAVLGDDSNWWTWTGSTWTL